MFKSWLNEFLRGKRYHVVRTDSGGVAAASLSVARMAGLPGVNGPGLVESANKVGHLACLKELLVSQGIGLVLDVGAFEGQFARSLRDLGYTGRIVSFEPNPDVLSKLQRAAAKDPNWSIMTCGIGRQAGQAELTSFKSASFTSTKKVNRRAKKRFGEMVESRNVHIIEIRTLTEVIEELGIGDEIRCGMLKVDTQGGDLEVLEGAIGALSEFRIIQVEAAIQPLYEDAPLLESFSSLLQKYGFRLSHISGISHEPQGLGILETDCIFCKDSW